MARLLGPTIAALAVAVGAGAVRPAASVAAVAGSPCATPHPWCNPALSPDRRAGLLMSAMTRTDKENVVSNNAVPPLGIPAAVSNFTDGPVGAPAGLNSTQSGTGLPSASALGATFAPAMASRYGDVVANDARMYGYDGIWGPTLNTLRTPLAGRGEEYFGEDPFLISQLAVAEVRAEQARAEMVQIKHFVGNDQEGQGGVPILSGSLGGRFAVNVMIDARTLHEIYLAPFAAVIQQTDPASVMCSYNRLASRYACESPDLLSAILRGQLHFPGFVSPDFGADHNPVANFNAGMDTGYRGTAELGPLLAAGLISSKLLDEHVHRILRTFFDHGVFDRAPYTDVHKQIDVTGEQATAQRIEEQGATLLVNRNHTLPLSTQHIKTLAVIGSAAARYVRGSGSPEVAPFFHQSLLRGIQQRVGAGIKVIFNDGTNPASAAATAKSADAAIVAAADSETEGTDKPCMALDCPSAGLPDLQNHDPQLSAGRPDELISAVGQAQPRTVVVLETGEPVLTPWRNRVGALLEAWYPGEAGGTAIAHVLFGDVDAAGRLSSTFPASEKNGPATSATENPSRYPGDAAENETYSERVLVGYRWYDAKRITPAFPFGFGLSYTTFALSKLIVRPTSPAGATVSVTVRNTGRRTGYAVPELYVGLPEPSPSIVEPPSQLAGFAKVRLAPGASRRVSFTLDAHHLSYWDTVTNSWRIARGCATIKVGTSSRDLPLAGMLADGGASGCARCPAATGRLRGRTLGPLRLGITRARARRAFPYFSTRGRRYMDFFCLSRSGIRIGYPSGKLLRTLPGSERRRVRGRVVLALTASRHYTLRGVRLGERVAAVARRLGVGKSLHIGLNY